VTEDELEALIAESIDSIRFDLFDTLGLSSGFSSGVASMELSSRLLLRCGI
jgi:hypothetical protein